MLPVKLEPSYVEALVGMGFTEPQARLGLSRTHSVSTEAAVTWLVEHPEAAETAEQASSSSAAVGLGLDQIMQAQPVMGVPSPTSIVIHPGGDSSGALLVGVSFNPKVVIVVPRQLNMGPGKLGAQCAHAAVGLYRLMMRYSVPWLPSWIDDGEKTIVLGVDADSDLDELIVGAQSLHLLYCEIFDAGRTEVAAGSRTAVAIGGLSDDVDKVTGHLRLF